MAPLPMLILDSDMQNCIQTFFQEYVLSLSRQSTLQHAGDNESVLSASFSRANLATRPVSLASFFQDNIAQIEDDLMLPDNEGLFRMFYHCRWLQVVKDSEGTPSILQNFYKEIKSK